MINIKKVKKLRKAEKNVIWLVEHDGSIDMHGLSYWAGIVEKLRKEIKEAL
jgi:hypothetical protein